MREAYPNELYHHGILGQRWGIRRYQNKDGSLTKAGRERYGYTAEDTVFLSGKTKYDKPIDDGIKKQVDAIMDAGANIVIGDAPGADKRLQDYIAEKGYNKVKVYTTDTKARNNVGDWKEERIDPLEKERKQYDSLNSKADEYANKKVGNIFDNGSFDTNSYYYEKKLGKDEFNRLVNKYNEAIDEYYRKHPAQFKKETNLYQKIYDYDDYDNPKVRRQKDIAMTKASNKGLAVMPIDDRRGSAMSKNVKRLKKQRKPVAIYDYNTGQFYYK